MHEIAQHRILVLAVQTVNRFHGFYDDEVISAAAHAFSAIVSTEYFMTYQDEIIPPDFAEELFTLEDTVLQRLITDRPHLRPKCRAILDVIRGLRRQLGRK